MARQVVHASTVAFSQAGQAYAVVLGGASGSGKSSLALELLALGAQLVSDDHTILWAEGSRLFATAPDAIRGLIEWHGVGVIPADALARAEVVLWVDMDKAATARMPDPSWKTVLDIQLPCMHKPATGPVAAGLRQYMIAQAWKAHGAGRI